MTFAELIDLLRSRGWAHRVWIEGVHEIGRTDNILLLLRSDGAREEWRLASYERGQADTMADGLDEQAAVAAVLAVLEPTPPRTTSSAASLDLRDVARKDTTTWTL